MTPHRVFAIAVPIILVSALVLGIVLTDDDHDCDAATCSTCGGSGKVTCSACNGTGYFIYGGNAFGCTSCGGAGIGPKIEPNNESNFGSGKVSCSTCGGTGSIHTHSYSKTGSKYYTCGGWVYTYTCSCGDSYTSGTGYTSHNYVSDGGHWSGCSYYTDKKCSRCGATTSSFSYTSHSWGSWTTTTAATCTTSGTQTRTCSDCGSKETQTISATGHSYVDHSAVSATCTASGNDRYYTCSKCSTIFDSSKTVISSIPTKAALGHDWGSWTTTKAATCTETGTQKHTCSRCSVSATQSISALGHDWKVGSYSWSDDCSSCTVSFGCSRDSSHVSSSRIDSTCRIVEDSEVRSTYTYEIEGTDASTGIAFSDSKVRYSHSAVLKYSSDGTDVPSSQSSMIMTDSGSPSGSASFVVGTSPTLSGKVFGTWSDGSDHAPGSSISVLYGSIATLSAVWEDEIRYTTVPTASCFVKPVIDYGDDGSYTLQSRVSLSSPIMTLGSGTWTDPGYRDPPEADITVRVTDDLTFTSNDSAYTVKWTINDSSGADSDKASMFAMKIGLCKEYNGSKYHTGYSYSVDECIPSWITWDAGLVNGDAETGWFELTIRPALQQVSEDTHGDYWIWFSCTYPRGLGSETTTYLVEFSVDVSWAGGVIVPETYSTFILRLDFGLPNGANNITMRQQLSADATEYRFPIKDYSAIRDGYTFKGWSMTSGSKTTDIGEEFPMNIGSASVLKSFDEDGNKVYTCTIYAVWEENETPSVSIPDDLRDLLGLLQDPYVLGLFVLVCFLVAMVVRVRRQGMM